METPVSACTVFFWPSRERIHSEEASEAYSDSIWEAAESGTDMMDDLPIIDLPTLAEHVFHWHDAGYPWDSDLQPRAVLVVPADVRSGHALPNGHLFDVNCSAALPHFCKAEKSVISDSSELAMLCQLIVHVPICCNLLPSLAIVHK